MANVTVTLKKSLIGRKKNHIGTAHSLGLKKIGDQRIIVRNSASEGKLKVIHYLIEVA